MFIKFVMYPRNLPHGRKEDWNKFIVFIAVVIDSIWYVRNMVVHQNLTLDIPQLLKDIRRGYEEQLSAWASDVPVWELSDPHCFKINFDAALSHNTLVSAIICRDDRGHVIAALLLK